MEIWLNQHNNAAHFTTNAIQEYFREQGEKSPGPGPGPIQRSLHPWEKRIKHKPPNNRRASFSSLIIGTRTDAGDPLQLEIQGVFLSWTSSKKIKHSGKLFQAHKQAVK